MRALAPDHVLGPYLLFLAGIVDAQAAAHATLPLPTPPAPDQLARAAEHAMPPLGAHSVRGNPDLAACLDWLLTHLDLSTAPDEARAAVDTLRALPETDRMALATGIAEGAYPTDRVAEALFVAAALQVHLARLAAGLDPAVLPSGADGVCPACGAPPVSSLVVGWTAANKARYCACSLCGTLWNHVRIKCTACGGTGGIAYYTLEDEIDAGAKRTVGVETCTDCRSYIKHMQQHDDVRLDPVADDVATYALDLLAREQDFRRSSINPLFLNL